MKRWNTCKDSNVENPRIDAFLAEVIELSRKHGLSIAHEDFQGGFEIYRYSESLSEWLMDAADATEHAKPL